MKKSTLTIFSILISCSVFSQITHQLVEINSSSDGQLSGPRFGVTYISEGTTSQVLNRVNQMDSTAYANYSGMETSITTQYGWQFETRFADTGGPVVGLVEWVVLVAGMEKGLFLPSFSSLVGVRGENGFEFATGPNLSGSGLGFVFALGYNYKKGDLNLPINIGFVPNKIGPSGSSGLSDLLNSNDYFDEIREQKTGYRFTVSIGFNLKGGGKR